MTRIQPIPLLLLLLLSARPSRAEDPATTEALALQQRRVELVRRITPAVCAIFRGGGGGSGVIIHPDGWVITNFHVSGFSKELRVGLPDHRIYKATVVGTDPTGDIALLKLQGKRRWPHAPLGDSDTLQQGEWVIAAGNPFLLATDFTPTVTMGIVSGTHRFLSGAGGFQLTYPDAIATDAPINPGNSGGPLFNMAGEVVGINGRISLRDRGRVNVGAGYAISANAIKNLLGTLHAGEIVERGNMDATVRNEEGKVLFDQMFEDSAAHRAGLRIGDELIRFDGIEIATANQFMNRIWTLIAGWEVEVVARRDGKLHSFRVQLGAIPQRGKKRKGNWAPLGLEWRKRRARELAADWADYRGPRGPLEAQGKGYRGSYAGFEPRSVAGGNELLLFLAAAVKRNGTEFDAAAARRLRLVWSLAPTPEELLGQGHLAQGELAGSGRIDGHATIEVVYPGPDDEKLHFHYDPASGRLAGLERRVGDKLDLRIAYGRWRRFDSRTLPALRRIERPGGKPRAIELAGLRAEGLLADTQAVPAPIAADAPRKRPSSALAPALRKATPALVKIYGAGHVKGIPSYGTGVLVSPGGRILTYNSAMLTTPNLYVVLHDGRQMPAKLVHRDFDRDVAMLEINGKDLPFLAPHAGPVMPGQWVVAIGNAFNLAQGAEPLNVNLGMLSAVTRLHARRSLADFPYQGEVLVVDAQINPGSYGGPLLDVAGRWIGLAGKVLASKETNTQFHYALPVAAIADLVAGKPKSGTAAGARGGRVFTGLIFLDAGPFSSPPPYVDRVFPASPAAAAGFRKDDLVLRVGQQRVKTIEEFKQAIRSYRPGQSVTLSVKRGAQVLRIKLRLEADEDDEGEGPAKARKAPATLAGWINEFTLQLREAASPLGKRSAALKLASLGRAAAPTLAGLLRVKDSEIRQAALAGLRALGPDAAAATDALRAVLARGRAEDLRRETAQTLARLGPAALPAAGELIELLASPDVVLRGEVLSALVAIGPGAVPQILARLDGPAGPGLELALKELGRAALPALLAALDRPADRRRALRGLGALGPAAVAALPRLLLLLTADDLPLRQAAIRAAGELRDPRAVAPLLARLERDEAAVLDALEALSPAAESAVPRLVALLAQAGKGSRASRLLRCLGAIGRPAESIVEAVRQGVEGGKLAGLPETPRTLARLGAASLPLARRLLASREPEHQRVGLVAVGLLEQRAVSLLDAVLPHAGSTHPDLARLALECIGVLGRNTPAVERALIDGLRSRRREVVWSALWAAGRCKSKSAAVRRRLIRHCASFDEQTQEAALRALAACGGRAAELMPVYTRAISHFRPEVRQLAMEGLGGLVPPPAEAVGALIEGFADEDWEVKRTAVAALARIGEPAVLKLILALDSPDPARRFLAAHTLAEMGPRAVRAGKPLIKLLADQRAEVRERAATCLGNIGPAAAAARAALVKALDDPLLDVALAAAAALRKITGKNYAHPSEWAEDRPFKRPDVKEKK